MACDSVLWLCENDADLGDPDYEWDDADDPDDLTTALASDEAFMDDEDPDYSEDENGCVNYCEAGILCYADVTASPPKTKSKRKIRSRKIHMTKKRIKRTTTKGSTSPGGGGPG